MTRQFAFPTGTLPTDTSRVDIALGVKLPKTIFEKNVEKSLEGKKKVLPLQPVSEVTEVH